MIVRRLYSAIVCCIFTGRRRCGPVSYVAPALLAELPLDIPLILGDTHYNTPAVRTACQCDNRLLVALRWGPYPYDDRGVQGRQIFYQLRSEAIEAFNQLFKNLFGWHDKVPVKGLRRTQRIVLAAVLLYQIVLLYQHENQLPLGRGIKPFLRAA